MGIARVSIDALRSSGQRIWELPVTASSVRVRRSARGGHSRAFAPRLAPYLHPLCRPRSFGSGALFGEPAPVATDALTIDADNLVGHAVAGLAPYRAGRDDSLRLAQRGEFLADHSCGLGLCFGAAQPQSHEAKRDDALRFPDQASVAHRQRKPRIPHSLYRLTLPRRPR